MRTRYLNCGLTASAKIYALPDALRGWRQHRCNGLRQVGTVSWNSHRFLPRTLCAPPSLVACPCRASALQECISANRGSQNLQRGIMTALSISYASIPPHTSESLQISARFSVLLALIFGGIRGTSSTVAAHCDVFVHRLVLMFQSLIQGGVLLGCHLGDLAFTTEARITGRRFRLRQRGLRSERAGGDWWKARDPVP